jgi:hypothetical protein
LQICINGEAKQKEGHSSVSLGTSSGLDPGSKQLKFAGGQACWQGPKRSMTVRLECGMAEELMQVEEPSRCEYAAVLLTPAACSHEDMHTAEAELRELTLIMTQVGGGFAPVHSCFTPACVCVCVAVCVCVSYLCPWHVVVCVS